MGLFRGLITNGMKKQDGPSLSWPTAHTIPFFLPPKTPHRSYSVQIRSQKEDLKHPPQTVPATTDDRAVIARTLQATSVEVDLLYLCDSEASMNKVSRWIGSGPRTTLAEDANADIMTLIFE